MKLPGPGTIYLSQNCQFRAPVFIGDTVTARVECVEKLEARKWVKFKTTVTNQEGKLVVDGGDHSLQSFPRHLPRILEFSRANSV